MKINIAVGSTNPVKIEAVREGFKRVFHELDELTFENYSVSSGVSDQPIGDIETFTGALNRAKQAFHDFSISHDDLNPNYSIGIEGGLAWSENDLECFAWTVIYDGRIVGKSRSASFILPECLAVHIRNGMELGVADDLVFGRTNSKHGAGTVGKLTNGVLRRSEYYEQTVVLAFIPFQWPDMFPPTSQY